MHLIVYTSSYVAQDQPVNSVLTAICTAAKKNNPELNISGLLFFHQNRFLQIIEGEQDHLETLMAILGKDSRHTAIERLMDETIETRKFSQWNMDTLNLDGSNTMTLSHLRTITDLYKANLTISTEVVVDVYKAMLAKL